MQTDILLKYSAPDRHCTIDTNSHVIACSMILQPACLIDRHHHVPRSFESYTAAPQPTKGPGTAARVKKADEMEFLVPKTRLRSV